MLSLGSMGGQEWAGFRVGGAWNAGDRVFISTCGPQDLSVFSSFAEVMAPLLKLVNLINRGVLVGPLSRITSN